MSQTVGRRLLLVVVVIAGAVALTVARPVRLGLDLRGGTQVVLEAQDTDLVTVDGDVASRTLEVLRRRVDALGVSEPTLQLSGQRRIIVELPGLGDPDEAVRLIGQTAQLSFHPVLEIVDVEDPSGEFPGTGAGDGGIILTDEGGERLRLGPAAVGGEAVGGAAATFDSGYGQWVVTLDFRGDGSDQWARLTADAACAPSGDPRRRIAIVLDDGIISSPQVGVTVECGVGITGGTTVITGGFTEAEAKDLALLIQAGALPVPVEIMEQRTIGPTLGEEAIDASVKAAIIGAALTMFYLIIYYRLLGLLAALGLLAYGLLSYSGLLALNATLTLPGIAGFVLAIGIAVDANVLAFEGIKEEHLAGRDVAGAASGGFRRAWSAILDSNVTTVLAALLLFFFASGAVRGFGITLTIGVIASMFTALVVTRLLIDVLLRWEWVARRPKLLGLKVGSRLRAWLTEHRPDLLGRWRLWFGLSGLLLVLAIAGITGRGLSFGLEFSGGRLLEYSTSAPVDVDELRSQLGEAGLPRVIVQESGQGNVTIRTAVLSAEEEAVVGEAVARLGGSATMQRDEMVGPTIGGELRRKALIALGLALAAQLVYLAIRFRWTYGASAVVAMFHDLVLLLGVFAWLGKELDGVFLAALLTVIGYSINDSVVVFDRIREDRRATPTRETLRAVANNACLQTVPRTVNTGLGALFILVALYLLGGDTLADFALALIVGILVGTYSSVFTAAPLAVALEGAVGERPSSPPAPREGRATAAGPAGRGGSGSATPPRPAIAQPVGVAPPTGRVGGVGKPSERRRKRR